MSTWHTEFCDDDHCEGECHQDALECDECGELHVFEVSEPLKVGDPCEYDCEGKLAYPEPYEDEGLAERRQMGFTALD